MEEMKLPYLTRAKVVPLWVLTFFTGWFIMQTELVGARVLTPYFGNSIFVWGSVIAVFLLALALGYSAGGRLTRQITSHWFPAMTLLAAGLLVGVSVLYQDRLSFMLVKTGIDVRWSALIASILLYGIPMVLAGMIAPFAVHLAAGSRSEVGSRAGTLYAVSTLGSFLGSLATSFILIPSFSLPISLVGGGVMAALAAVVVGIALSSGDKPAVALSLGFTVVVVAAMTYSPHKITSTQHKVYQQSIIGGTISNDPPSTLAKRLAESQKAASAEAAKYAGKPGPLTLLDMETPYNKVVVTQDGPTRLLTFGQSGLKLCQTAMNLNDIRRHVSEYTEVFMAPVLYKQDIKRVLLIGLGGGDTARGIETCFPNVEMDVVEIDPAVVKIARDYFFWKPSKNVKVYNMDGRSFVNMHVMTAPEKKYDVVMIDVFDSDFIPFHLTTAHFFGLLQCVLANDGVVAMNVWVNHELYSYQARTINAVFGNINGFQCHRTPNVILVAQNGRKKPLTPEDVLAARKKITLPEDACVDLRYITTTMLPKPNWVQEGEVLTDVWAPVERMLSAK